MAGERRRRGRGRRKPVLPAPTGLLLGALLFAGLALAACAAPPPAPFDASSRPVPVPRVDGWVPVDCADRPTELRFRRQRHGGGPSAVEEMDRAIRNARPGDRDHLPYPDPATEGEVIADFEHWWWHGYGGLRAHLRQREEGRSLSRALRRGEVGYRVRAVVDWTARRCEASGVRPFLYLLRLTDGEGREMARAVLRPSGAVATLMGPLQGPLREPLEPLAVEAVLRSHGVAGTVSGIQPVTLHGMHGCGPIAPCYAARVEERVFVVGSARSHGVYEIPPDGRRLSVAAYQLYLHRALGLRDLCCGQRSEPRQVDEELLAYLRDPDRPFLSIGYGWARARRVAPGRDPSVTPAAAAPDPPAGGG